MTEADLDAVRVARNRPEVRRMVFTSHQITPDEHRAWFARLASDASRRAYVFADDTVRGVVTFTDIHPGDRTAAWGFYTAAGASPGTGTRMLEAALDEAFGALALEKVWAEVIAHNAASIRLHAKLGFAHEGTLRSHHVGEGGARVDVLRYGLLRGEWPSRT